MADPEARTIIPQLNQIENTQVVFRTAKKLAKVLAIPVIAALASIALDVKPAISTTVFDAKSATTTTQLHGSQQDLENAKRTLPGVVAILAIGGFILKAVTSNDNNQS